MRNIFYIFILGLWSLQGFAQQDTVGQMPVLEVSELSNVAPQESYITKYLRFFDRRFDVAEIVEDDEEIVPMLGSEDSIYQERLQNINSLMQLPYNTKVRNYIDVYLSKKRNQTKVMLALSRYYFPVFERELAKHNLPDELKYLAIIESALNPRAYSRAGAGGLWQFMYRTGKMYGLKVDKELDERFDAEKATVAATLYLKYLYGLYNDWTLAIAAYNCGPGNVNKAIRRARNKRDYWEIYNFLPRETRNYVPAFIGATYAMTYYREHGIAIAETEFPEVTDTLMITKELYFSRISEFTGVPLQTIRDYNPQYKLDFIPERQEAFTLKLPCDYILKFIEFADSIYANPPSKEEAIISELMAEQKLTQAPSKVTYRVKRGENLSLIAVRFGVKVDQLMEWNDLKSTLLQVNQILTVYTIKRNMRDMSEVVAYQNAEKAKEAALAVAKQPQQVQKPAQKQPAKPVATPRPKPTVPSQRPSATAAVKEKPAEAQHPTTHPQSETVQTLPAASNAAKPTSLVAAPKTTSPTNSPSNLPATVQPNIASIPAKSSTYQSSSRRPQPKKQPSAPKVPSVSMKSSTGNMQSGNVPIIQAKTATPGSKFVHYKVKQGETLFSIQRKHQGSSVQEIINMNNLRDNGNKIYPNQVLKIRVK